jgi:peptidoglycan-associated lipoprotein
MNTPVATRITLMVLSVAVLGVLTACAGRHITTSVEDQTFVPGPPPQAAAPANEPPARALREQQKVEVPPPTAPVESARVIEPPIASPPPGEKGALADVYFDYDMFLIRRDGSAVLEANARLLKADGLHTLLIEGHCDERGTLAYNLVLGERRARAVNQYLQDLGVPASQLQMTSYGKERPFCTEHSEACWQSNRRAHFRP